MRVLLILLSFLLTCELVPVDHLETTNVFLRNLLPWWPQEQNVRSTSENDTSLILNETILPDLSVTPPSLLDLQKSPSSPLDNLEASTGTKKAPMDSENFLINFDEMAECPKDCSTGLRDALSIILQDMSHTERYTKICGKYNESITCMKEDARCVEEDRGMFEAMTSGFQYMCVEQGLAFNATIKCIDDEASLVQSECDNQCQTKNLFMNWVMRSTMQNSIQQGVSDIVGAATGSNPNALAGWANALQGGLLKQGAQPPVDPQQGFESFRQLTNDLCRIGDCMLDCIRSKFNTRCEGSAGTLLSEVFVRPIAAGQNKLTMLRPVLGMFMPEHCSYITSSSELKKHRIDSTMDSELKRMYTEKYENELKERAAQDDLLSSLVPLDSNGVPIPGLKRNANSPLDISEKTLDEMILEMYSKNDNSSTVNEDATEKLIEELMIFNETSSFEIENSEFNSTEIYGNSSLIEDISTMSENTTELLKAVTTSEYEESILKAEASEVKAIETSRTIEFGSGSGVEEYNEASGSETTLKIEESGESSGAEESGNYSGFKEPSGTENLSIAGEQKLSESEASGYFTETKSMDESSGQSEIEASATFSGFEQSSRFEEGSASKEQEYHSESEASGYLKSIEEISGLQESSGRSEIEGSGDFSVLEKSSGIEEKVGSGEDESEASGHFVVTENIRESSGVEEFSRKLEIEGSGDISDSEESSRNASGSGEFSKIEKEFETLLEQL